MVIAFQNSWGERFVARKTHSVSLLFSIVSKIFGKPVNNSLGAYRHPKYK